MVKLLYSYVLVKCYVVGSGYYLATVIILCTKILSITYHIVQNLHDTKFPKSFKLGIELGI